MIDQDLGPMQQANNICQSTLRAPAGRTSFKSDNAHRQRSTSLLPSLHQLGAYMLQSATSNQIMTRKTMRIGDIRTSIKLEPMFWNYFKDLAQTHNLSLPSLINKVADTAPHRSNLASTLRMFALSHAKTQSETLQVKFEQLSLSGNTLDLIQVLQACPLPCVTLDADRIIRDLNAAFTRWLNVDGSLTIGQRIDNVLLMRNPDREAMWSGLANGRKRQGQFSAVYLAPGRVRTAQATVLALAAEPPANRHNYVVMFAVTGRRTGDAR